MAGRLAAPEPGRRAPGSRISSGGLAALAVVALVACRNGGGSEPLPPVRHDLAELAASARRTVETGVVDVGEPSAREHLAGGFGPDEPSPEGSFAWSRGAAALRFEVVEPRELALGLRGWAYPHPGSGERRVAVRLNGAELGELTLATAPRSLRLPIAAERVVPGENRLELRPLAPDSASGAPNPTAGEIAWDLVRFSAAAEPPPPTTLDAGGDWRLPARTAISWTLELPADSWLAWETLARTGGAELAVDVRAEGGEESSSRATGAGRRRLTAPRVGPGAPGATGEPPLALVELRLRALGEGGEIRIRGLSVHSPAPAAAPAAAGRAHSSAPEPAPQRPNLVVYVIDTLRADHLGAYGYPVPTSPRIDAFAREAILWREARAQSSWTKPAMATLLTGLHPISHGADRRSRGLAPDVVSIGARLAAVGYQTAFFTTNPTVTAKFGFERGFEEYRYLSRPRGAGRARGHVDSGEIQREVVAWLERRDPERPFLLVVHTLDPHDPYRPPPIYQERFAPGIDPEVACCVRARELAALPPEAARLRARQMMALYDGEIAQNDASFGALLDELARRDLLARSAVLLTSDHGEEFYDHGGWRHASTLYEEVLRIPFVLRLPGGARAGVVVDDPADQIDVVPTLLDLAGVALPAGLPGGSWLPALDGGEPPARDSFAWLEHPSFSLAAATRAGWKGIWLRGGWRPPHERGADELYELTRDPREQADLSATRGMRRRWLAALLAAEAARHGRATPATEVAIDAELERSLRALGYF